MELQRNIYKKLIDWKSNNNGKSSILIEGARRVGKTTIATKFAKESYSSYALLDLSKISPKLKQSFLNNMNNLDLLFQDIQLETGTNLKPRKSVIVFDEIQSFPKAREAIKHFVADGRYDFIETGSLISIKENVENIIIPSEEDKIKMYPLDFQEFVSTRKESVLYDYLNNCFLEKKTPDKHYHERAMRLFYEYLLVGGMPSAVSEYIDNNLSFYKAEAAKQKILQLYNDDIKKSQNKYQLKVSRIFSNIPRDLSTHSKTVRLSNFPNEKLRFADYDSSLYRLSDAMLCNLCYKSNDPNIGFELTADSCELKCYLSDTGLLFTQAFSESQIKNNNLFEAIISGKLSLNKGMLFENIIAQMLVSMGHKLYFYSHYNLESKRNDIEIDFLLSNNNVEKPKIVPIEVKSSKNFTTTSFDLFKKKFKKRVDVSLVISPKLFKIDKENKIIYLPPYMLPFIDPENLQI